MLRRIFAVVGALALAWLAIKRRPSAAPVPAIAPIEEIEEIEEEVPLRQWRRPVAYAIAAAFLIGTLVLLISWYTNASTPVDPPIGDGGLYLLVDKPDVTASLIVVVQDPEDEHPYLGVRVVLSDPKARFAVVAQGDWAYTNYPGMNPGAPEPRPGSVVSRSDTDFFIHEQEQPSVVVSGPAREQSLRESLGGLADYDINGHLNRPIQVAGRGRQRGSLPWITVTQTIGSVGISGIDGSWTQPKSTRITLHVQEFGGFSPHLEYSSPTAKEVDYGVQWQQDNTIMSPRWELANPDAGAQSDREIFLIGLLLGIWSAVLVGVAESLVRRWIGARG